MAQLAKDMVSYHEEYAIWKDQLLTREEYDDNAVFRNGKSILITGAQLRVRYLTPANIVIAAQLSPIHDISFDRERTEYFDQLLQGKMSLDQFVEAIERLPRNIGEL